MMKVLIVSQSYSQPTIQKSLVALASYCEIHCAGRRKLQLAMFKTYIVKPIPNVKKIMRLYRTLQFSRGQFALLTTSMGLWNFKPDIINVESNPWSLLFLQILLYRALYCRGAKIVCTVKKNTYRLKRGILGLLKQHLAKFTIKRVDHFIVASRLAATMIKSEFPFAEERMSICNQVGVDTELFGPVRAAKDTPDPAHRPVVIGYCGRLDEQKGVRDLVDAVDVLINFRHKNVKVYLLGGATDGGALERELREKRDNVGWLELFPAVGNEGVAGFLQKLDIFVLPSRVEPDHEEHDAYALLEAMSTGLACIGTESGVIPELLVDGCGVMVASGDAEALAGKIEALIDNPRLRRELGLCARSKVVREFSLSVVAERKYRILKQVLEAGTR